MSTTTTGKVRTYRPIRATMTLNFESNLSNDRIRSTTWWNERIGRIAGIRSVDVKMNREDVRIYRS